MGGWLHVYQSRYDSLTRIVLYAFNGSCCPSFVVRFFFFHQHKNLDTLLDRGEKLDDLVSKSEGLSSSVSILPFLLPITTHLFACIHVCKSEATTSLMVCPMCVVVSCRFVHSAVQNVLQTGQKDQQLLCSHVIVSPRIQAVPQCTTQQGGAALWELGNRASANWNHVEEAFCTHTS